MAEDEYAIFDQWELERIMIPHHYARIILALVLMAALVGGVSATDPPNASFSCTPLSGLSPLSVTCTDASTNSPTGWAWFFGDENYTQPWTAATAAASWSARQGEMIAVIPNGSIVLTGGQDSTTYRNDTWFSSNNGSTWTQINASSGWAGRDQHNLVALSDGSLLLMGGYNTTTNIRYYNDTWRSINNGSTWVLQNASSGWVARQSAYAVAFPDGNVTIFGGAPITSNLKDVWKSTDQGIHWSLINSNPGWAARSSGAAVVLPDNSIVMVGGIPTGGSGYSNDTWRSTDEGATWSQMNASSGWVNRWGNTVNAMPDGSILIMGGYSGIYQNDVWRSVDKGATWAKVNSSAGWAGRYSGSSLVIPNGSVLVMGGHKSGSSTNDVWQFQPVGSQVQNPGHTYTSSPQSSNVALTAYNTVGYNTTIKTNYETIYGNVIVGFTKQSTIGTGESFVTLTDTSLNSTAANWSFKNVTGNNTQVWFSTTFPKATITVGPGNWSFVENASNPISYNTSTSVQYVNVSAVTAAFSGTPLSGQTPFSTTFTDASTGSPSTWAWWFGDENYMQPWTNITSTAGWPARYGGTEVILPDGSIVIMGGKTNIPTVKHFSDVWRSIDNGVSWTQQTANAGWGYGASIGRQFPGSVALPDGSIVLFGGAINGTGTTIWMNDSWRSTDNGATWILLNNSCGWSPRDSMSEVVMQDGSIILLGGASPNSSMGAYPYFQSSDVWKSADKGASWTLVNNSAGWIGREHFRAVLLPDNSIVFTGGENWNGATYTYLNDVWRSTDSGNSWVEMNASPGFRGRTDEESLVVIPDGSIVLMGGDSVDSTGTIFTHYNDTWRSIDKGATWTEVNISSGYIARTGFNSVVSTDGSIILTGGRNITSLQVFNDTWRFQPVGSNLQSPTHQYTTPGNYSVSEMVTGSFGSNTMTKTGYINALPSATQWCGVNYLYYNDIASDKAGYHVLNNYAGAAAEIDENVTITSASGIVPIDSYITSAGYPGTVTLLSGMRTYYTWAYVSATGGASNLIFNLSILHGDGSSSPMYSQVTEALPGILTRLTTPHLSTSNITFSAVDRIIVNVSAVTARPAATTIHFLNGGAAHSSYIETGYFACPIDYPYLPITTFKQNITQGYVPLPVQFYDTSSYEISRFWDFGDGSNSTDPNPIHIYTNPGTYTVSLTGTNAHGSNTKIAPNLINAFIYGVPVVDFWGNPVTTNINTPVAFTDSSINSPTSFYWMFGDGTTSTQQNPSHPYSAIGSYSVNHSVTNLYGTSWMNKTNYITVVTNGTTILNVWVRTA